MSGKSGPMGKTGQEPAEKHLRTVKAAKEPVEKIVQPEKIEAHTGARPDHFEAMVACGTVALKGAESLSEAVLAFQAQALESGMSGATRLLECKTVGDALACQSDLARRQFESLMAHGSAVSDMALRVAHEIAAPFQARPARAGA